MAIRTQLRLFHLFHLSKPAFDRPIYQAAHQRQAHRIVEFGVGNGQRALRLIDVAAQFVPPEQITYVGIDPFEARGMEHGPGLTLKEAYRLLRPTGARVRFVPGDPLAVFPAFVNSLGIADLVLIDWPLDRRQLPHLAFYLERMLHEHSLVLFKEAVSVGSGSPKVAESVKVLPVDRIRSLAGAFRKAA